MAKKKQEENNQLYEFLVFIFSVIGTLAVIYLVLMIAALIFGISVIGPVWFR